jgi:hypothetical protein
MRAAAATAAAPLLVAACCPLPGPAVLLVEGRAGPDGPVAGSSCPLPLPGDDTGAGGVAINGPPIDGGPCTMPLPPAAAALMRFSPVAFPGPAASITLEGRTGSKTSPKMGGAGEAPGSRPATR